MKKMIVPFLALAVMLLVSDFAQAQLFRRGCRTSNNCGRSQACNLCAGCVCGGVDCDGQCNPHYQACIERCEVRCANGRCWERCIATCKCQHIEPVGRFCRCRTLLAQLRRPPCPSPSIQYAPRVLVTPYQICCSACTAQCGGSTACLNYCKCMYVNPTGSNCVKPPCLN